MRRLAFRVNGNAKQIAEALNWYTEGRGLYKMNGNAKEGSHYILDYDDNSYNILAYECEDEPSGVYRYFTNIPAFMTFPREVQKKMIERSMKGSPIPFILEVSASNSNGGFSWTETPEGRDFWSSVINNRNFELFNNYFKTKEYESRLQEQESPLRGGSGEVKCGICCRKHKPRVTVKSVGYKEVIGRG